jgi:hypothetical protein
MQTEYWNFYVCFSFCLSAYPHDTTQVPLDGLLCICIKLFRCLSKKLKALKCHKNNRYFFTFMIICNSVISKIKTLIGYLVEQFQIHIWCSVIFLCNWYMWWGNVESFVEPDSREPTLYTSCVALFTMMNNYVYRETLRKRNVRSIISARMITQTEYYQILTGVLRL